MIIAGTGHRPEKLGGYDSTTFKKLLNFAVQVLNELKPSKVISGMALGWDQALAVAAIHENTPFIAAIPFDGQESKWPQNSIDLYFSLLNRAAQKVVICDGSYNSWKMQKRNEWMVDSCDIVVALWDGSFGGTYNCIQYANKIGKPVANYWDKYSILE